MTEHRCELCDRRSELLDADGLCPTCAAENARLDAAWDEGWDSEADVSLAVVSL